MSADELATEAQAGRLTIAEVWLWAALDRQPVRTVTELAAAIGLPVEMTRAAMIQMAERGLLTDASEEERADLDGLDDLDELPPTPDELPR